MTIRSALFIAVMLALPCAAVAQTDTDLGTRIPHPKRAAIPGNPHSPEDSGRISLSQFARCTFASKPAAVVAALQLPVDSGDNALKAVVDDNCLEEGEMGFSNLLFRGALFGEMYRQHEHKSRTWTYAIQPLDFSAVPDATSSPNTLTNYFMLAMADCLLAKDADSVRGIVLNEPASGAQNAAFAKIIPQLGSCVPAGATVKFSRTSIENAFGEYLYRSLVPPIPVSSGKAS